MDRIPSHKQFWRRKGTRKHSVFSFLKPSNIWNVTQFLWTKYPWPITILVQYYFITVQYLSDSVLSRLGVYITSGRSLHWRYWFWPLCPLVASSSVRHLNIFWLALWLSSFICRIFEISCLDFVFLVQIDPWFDGFFKFKIIVLQFFDDLNNYDCLILFGRHEVSFIRYGQYLTLVQH